LLPQLAQKFEKVLVDFIEETTDTWTAGVHAKSRANVDSALASVQVRLITAFAER
jgi:hypothetical protein